MYSKKGTKNEERGSSRKEMPFNWLTDPADFCDRHGTAFPLADGCPICMEQTPNSWSQAKPKGDE